MLIKKHKQFIKSFSLLRKPIQEKVLLVLKLFSQEYNNEQLRNHALQGKWKGFRSINVTGDIRIIFRELSDGTYELVELVHVGAHSQLYG